MAEIPFTDQHITITGHSGAQIQIRFRDLVEFINEGVYCVNGDGLIVFANEKFGKALNYKATDIIGKSIFDFVHGEENRRISKAKLDLRKKGISDSYDILMRKSNGDPVWLRLSGKPVIDPSGEFMGVIVLTTEIARQRRLEEELIYAKEDLESKVIARTRQLSEANQMLNEEIKERKMADFSLKNSEKRFRDIFNNSPDAIYIESKEGIILDVNEATCKLHEGTREQLIGRTIFDISPKHIHEQIKQSQPQIIDGGLNKFESECLTVTGKIVPIEVSAAHIDFKGQKSILVHVRDISERVKHQELLERLNSELEQKVRERTKELEREIAEKENIQKELQRQKDFLRLIIDSTPNMIFVKDQEGKYLLANESVARFYNVKPSEMEGHYDSEDHFTQQELNEFKEQDQQALESKKEVQFPEQQVTNIETGEHLWIQMVKKAIPSISGNETNILGVATDITAVKVAKEEIRISEQLYREIARNLPKAAMFIFDKNLKYILAEGPLVGIVSKPKNEIEGKTVYDSIRESDRARVKQIYTKILDGESSETEQTFFERSLKVYHLPIRDDHGQIIYGMVMVFDISDLKGVQRELEHRATQLQRSNEELERFAYVASHDLQGPLRTIASYLQLLEMRYKNKLDAEAVEFIDYSVNGAKRMQQLILDLLNYSKISSAPKPFVKTDLNELVNLVLKGLNSTIKLSKAMVNVAQLPVLMADQNQLYQLFQNLIDNGMKFVKKDVIPVIDIKVTEKPEEWEFTIADNGIGIKDEYKEKIFQIFQRLHSNTEYTGTGVGLAICKKVVQLHGGRIWFTSVPEQGTTFYFTISKHAGETHESI